MNHNQAVAHPVMLQGLAYNHNQTIVDQAFIRLLSGGLATNHNQTIKRPELSIRIANHNQTVVR